MSISRAPLARHTATATAPRKPSRTSSVLIAGAGLAALGLTTLLVGCPKPPPPRMPPKEVPRLNQMGDKEGERGDVFLDAVQSGSNLARMKYNCGPPSSVGTEGRGVLSAEITKCEFNRAENKVTLSNESTAECNTFFLTVTNYKGSGTYNTSSLGKLSLGTAQMSQAACKWNGTLCMDWDGQSGPHPESNCTVEITSDGGLQYGTAGATVSGTFVCADFIGPWKGCAGAPAKVNCSITGASFSVAGCTVTGKAGAGGGAQTPDKDAGKKKGGKKGAK